MKKFMLIVVATASAAIAATGIVHFRAIEAVRSTSAQADTAHLRRDVLGDLTVQLERYRRMSGSFRKLSPDEVVGAKNALRRSFRDALDKLEPESPSSEDAKTVLETRKEARSADPVVAELRKDSELVDELLALSQKLEPQLFSKDAFSKEEVRDLYDALSESLSTLRKTEGARLQAMRADGLKGDTRSLQLIIGCGVMILLLLLAVSARNQIAYVIPLRKLRDYAVRIRSGAAEPDKAKDPAASLAGMHSEIRQCIDQLSGLVESAQKERHRFISDVVSDLKAPLTMLQAGKYLLGPAGAGTANADPALEVQAAEAVKLGLLILSGTLEDLGDAMEIGRIETRFRESVIDLSELVSGVARTLNGPGGRQISLSLPAMPVWTLTDPRRMERTLIQVISKVAQSISQHSGQNGARPASVHVTLQQPAEGSHRGIEILVQDGERVRAGRVAANGPELDVMKHWIAEQGLGMSVVSRIVRAQGGTVTASGVAGTSAQVVIRLPQDRSANTGLLTPPRGLNVNLSRGLDGNTAEKREKTGSTPQISPLTSQ